MNSCSYPTITGSLAMQNNASARHQASGLLLCPGIFFPVLSEHIIALTNARQPGFRASAVAMPAADDPAGRSR
jgi:hypothetical protein